MQSLTHIYSRLIISQSLDSTSPTTSDLVANASTTATPSVSGSATPAITESDTEDAGVQVGSVGSDFAVGDTTKWTSIKKEEAVAAPLDVAA